jgi:hypothetical protein
MVDKLLQRAAQRLLQENEKPIELSELPFHLALYPKGNILTVEIRKRWKINLSQPVTPTAIYIKKLLTAVFSKQPVVAKIKIECCDEFQVKAKAKRNY